ncbi:MULTISPECIES: alpha-amylase family glycosyl hydrolase [Caldilinea]|jgi:sucrose phosphorylase|uniref:Putative sucrose phosphorylase n=1 Tax=Caldilinea aerophila (strain DSM 14535 / JCM 11387 / NBRC 104270 / STL-6-O1) TaxID=926550 RepID=I0I189_CALAS|nr:MULTISPECIES: alpha-amylase family glycosyl hydrolase [Caldilinea]MBO9393666.1 alpha-glucosidase C-terminal domain-containing protein [Caldilinea sp.]BAL99026.1 putative sucrose phosphorylase [Caldilinea aerophila DSM 14535 = NBRC 104270]GIV74384.1 MAG: sucrose phosphorylase [Caldilinea sp.]
MSTTVERLRASLASVYGSATAGEILERLLPRIEEVRAKRVTSPHTDASSMSQQTQSMRTLPDQREVILITYGDQIQEEGKPPLRTLCEVLESTVSDVCSGVHILPFYPYTSDDGFSVVDYRQVDPALGDWEEIRRLGRRFRLMFDAVINHISASSPWFQAFLRGEAPYTEYFITVDPSVDLSSVVRPRTSPLLTPFATVDGVKYVWTTFSADQVDLNYRSPVLLYEILDLLLFYVEQGAQRIRLDAVGFLWKEIGTSCIHLPQTHALIQAMRAMLDLAAPDVLLITETNVPHLENISYFGDGYNEAQMVYNFTLPPLTLYTFHKQDATLLSEWAASLSTPSEQTTFFNFMASHDGIGVRPLEGVLRREEIDALVERTLRHGGLVSYRAAPDGSQVPYELNIVYFDALNDPNADEPLALQVDRFLASQAILLGLAGVPGIYVHSLFGSRNWREGVTLTGQNRTINRRKFRRNELETLLNDPTSLPHQVFTRYHRLIATRTGEPAFHPNAPQQIVHIDPAIFAFVRTRLDSSRRVLCLHNVADHEIQIRIDVSALGLRPGKRLVDLISGRELSLYGAQLEMSLPPYGVYWLGDEIGMA